MKRPSPASEAAQPLPSSILARARRRISRRMSSLTALVGLLIFLALISFALFPGRIAPYDPTDLVAKPFARPSPDFILGANDLGQDLLSELIWGARTSLFVGLSVALIAVGLGTLVGLVAGYRGGGIGDVLMRLTDLILVLPFLPLIILLSAYLGPSQRNIILVLALVSWAIPARLIRARVLAIQNELYIEAAEAIGCSNWRILRVHIWPGVRLIALAQLMLVASAAILSESSLSFLGLGDPSVKSWGGMLYFARASGAFLGEAWRWWVLPAGLMISLSVMSLVLVAYSIEDVLEPRLRQGSRR